ncbi:DUF3703 domain-containing protein [Pseudoteredinibacter isoporae]|uniref:DUF3703 domain-containing protein n=1 Tax=Pseudoteredinibacter isoporae TaxID=570281 RepID=UPI00310574B0
MNPKRKAAFDDCLNDARRLFDQQEWEACFYQLENAHVLGQNSIGAHTLSHYWMLRVGWKQKSWKDIWGQMFRMIASPLITPLWVPQGNTGGANVSALKAMPLREELKPYFQ